MTDPSPYADHRLVRRRDTADPAVAALVDIVRELRDTGAFLPPEVSHEPGERPHGIDGMGPD
ncbi:hypothetical protein ACIPC1_11420 [Streptomyces sp. NPDC087263]|uniref:hypothetical protein n=1 Tax=Streptomyces sp. NPDC087263 TaxID=3365773 RepID=UPI0038046808